MDEQPEKSALKESWLENCKYWFAKWRFLFSPPVVLTAVVAICTLVSFFIITFRGPSIISYLYFGASFSLAVMVANLAAVRGGWILHVAAIFVLLLEGIGLVYAQGGSAGLIMSLLPLTIAVPILLTLGIIKLLCGKFTEAELTGQSFTEGLQFKIKHLLIATTIVAILIALVQTVAPFFFTQDLTAALIFSILAFVLSVNGLVSVWALFGQKIGWRILISLTTAIGAFAASQFIIVSLVPFMAREPTFFLTCGFFTTLTWLASTIELYLFRRQGYRFVRHTK